MFLGMLRKQIRRIPPVHELYVLPYVGSKRRMVHDIQMLAPIDANEL